MICGGAVGVFFLYSRRGSETISLAKRWKAFRARSGFWLISDLMGDGRLAIWSKTGGSFGFDIPQTVLESLSRQPARIKADIDIYAEQIGSSERSISSAAAM